MEGWMYRWRERMEADRSSMFCSLSPGGPCPDGSLESVLPLHPLGSCLSCNTERLLFLPQCSSALRSVVLNRQNLSCIWRTLHWTRSQPGKQLRISATLIFEMICLSTNVSTNNNLMKYITLCLGLQFSANDKGEYSSFGSQMDE